MKPIRIQQDKYNELFYEEKQCDLSSKVVKIYYMATKANSK
jgi:hypothetical protein